MGAHRHIYKQLPIGAVPVLGAVVGGLLASVLSVVLLSRDAWRPGLATMRSVGQTMTLVGAVGGLILGAVMALMLETWRVRLRAWLLRRRWRDARPVGLDRAVGPIEVEGRVTVRVPVTSRVGRVPCAAYLTRIELSDGTVEEHAEVGDLELEDGSGGIAELTAGPCAIALMPAAGEHELRLMPGDRVRIRARGRRVSGRRVALEADGDRLPTLVAILRVEPPGGG